MAKSLTGINAVSSDIFLEALNHVCLMEEIIYYFNRDKVPEYRL